MDELTPQEAAVLEQISRNPFAGQQEIADALGVARSTVAAQIAQLMKRGHILGRGYFLPGPTHLVCIGGAVSDRKYRALGTVELETSNPVESFHSHGGVARNVAENLALLGDKPGFVSIVGADQTGQVLLDHLRSRGVDVSRVITAPGHTTAEYGAILNPQGDLVMGIADMGIFDLLTPDALSRIWSHFAGASWIFADTNLPADSLLSLIQRRGGGRYKLAIDAVSTVKARKLPGNLAGIDLLFLNIDEAAAILSQPRATSIEGALDAARDLCARGAARAQVSMGAAGLAVAGIEGEVIVPALPAMVVDITGAGDAVVAGTLHSILAGQDLPRAAVTGSLVGALTIETLGTVRADLSPSLLAAQARSRPVTA
ncbi:MAG: PfkB family carbohydrate kinase [Pararhodobacter sp.]